MARVLVVEAREARAYAARLEEQLSAIGCTVTVVETADECFRHAAAQPPHVILAAAELEPVTGLNLCNAIKSDARLASVPFVILSSGPSASLEKHRQSATPADDYVQTSDDVRELVQRIRAIFGRKRSESSARSARPAISLPPPSSNAPPSSSRKPLASRPPIDDLELDAPGAIPSAPQIDLDRERDAADKRRLEAKVAALETELAKERALRETQEAEWAAAVAAARKDLSAANARLEAMEEEHGRMLARIGELQRRSAGQR
jgi:DNA-binding response OmpR family regulator